MWQALAQSQRRELPRGQHQERGSEPYRPPGARIYCYWMKFAPEYVTNVLNENFEDAKDLLLAPLMAINYAHLVMLAERGIISSADATALRNALDGISLDSVR